MEHFLRWERENPCQIIHFAGHGSGTKYASVIAFINGEFIELNSDEGLKWFEDLFPRNRKGAIILSCCSAGKSENNMQDLISVSNAEIVLSYGSRLEDRLAFLVEPLFYHIYLSNYRKRGENKLSPGQVREQFFDALKGLLKNEPNELNKVVVDVKEE